MRARVPNQRPKTLVAKRPIMKEATVMSVSELLNRARTHKSSNASPGKTCVAEGISSAARDRRWRGGRFRCICFGATFWCPSGVPKDADAEEHVLRVYVWRQKLTSSPEVECIDDSPLSRCHPVE